MNDNEIKIILENIQKLTSFYAMLVENKEDNTISDTTFIVLLEALSDFSYKKLSEEDNSNLRKELNVVITTLIRLNIFLYQEIRELRTSHSNLASLIADKL